MLNDKPTPTTAGPANWQDVIGIDVFDVAIPAKARAAHLIDWLRPNICGRFSKHAKAMISWMIENRAPCLPLSLMFKQPGLPDLYNPKSKGRADVGSLGEFIVGCSKVSRKTYLALDHSYDLVMVYMGVRSWEGFFKSEEEFKGSRAKLGIDRYYDNAWIYRVAEAQGISEHLVTEYLHLIDVYSECNQSGAP
ncbi:hypothetical protein WDW37_13945 [Bdellovibrionota bacterium FG-1]